MSCFVPKSQHERMMRQSDCSCDAWCSGDLCASESKPLQVLPGGGHLVAAPRILCIDGDSNGPVMTDDDSIPYPFSLHKPLLRDDF
jgi:hypothetical protein